MSSFEVRNYDPARDYPQLRANLEAVNLFDEDYEAEDRLARWINLQPDAIAVAASAHELLGSVYFQDGILPYIYRLAVRKDIQKYGIGTALLAEAERRAQLHGHPAVELNVDRDHPELLTYYRNRGYQSGMNLCNMYKLL